MFLSFLGVRGFRNLADQELELPASGLALVAPNGHGKTNFLESIYYLEIFRSFRGASDEQLVRFGGDVFRIEGRISRPERPVPVTAAYQRSTRRKKVTVDGVEPERLGDAIGSVGAVVFSPADVSIVAGSPAERRRYLDIVLSLTRPGYLAALQRYRRTLARRNALLRDGAAHALVSSFDHALVEAGSRVLADRAAWISAHVEGFATLVSDISGGGEARLEYLPSPPELGATAPPPTPNDAASVYRQQLAASAEREVARGMTLLGPHRDDFRVRTRIGPDWRDLRTYGSGGQRRTAAIALRMIEAESLRTRSGHHPILLLDDVFAELDPQRSTRILEWISRRDSGQVILTAPKPTDVAPRGNPLPVWGIEGGRIVG